MASTNAPSDTAWYEEQRTARDVMGLQDKVMEAQRHLDSGDMSYETAVLLSQSLRVFDQHARKLRITLLRTFPGLQRTVNDVRVERNLAPLPGAQGEVLLKPFDITKLGI